MERSGNHSRGGRARVGMAGGGQLARMTLQAAIDLDIELVVLDPDPGSPAIAAGATHMRGDPALLRDLRRLADATDVVTFDHEGVSNEALAALEREGYTVRPGAAAKRLAQDKGICRETFEAAGLPVPAWAHLATRGTLERFAERHGWPLVIKARSGGYDGRGVWVVSDSREAEELLAGFPPSQPLLVEEHVEITRELAVLVARRPGGECATYPAFETRQQTGICREVTVPPACAAETAREAERLATSIAALSAATGILCVELFETPRGLVVNELAMRPHNAGHVTLDAFATSQFENHLRAVLDWPLGSTDRIAPAAAMVNVLGPPDGSDPAGRLGGALLVEGARVRLYGKAARPGRKLGHVTATGPRLDAVRERAWTAAQVLSDA